MNKWTQTLGLTLISTSLFFFLTTAQAAPFSTDIIISGDTSLDSGFSVGGSGDYTLISGGGSTTSTYVDGTATGANPLAGSLTDINDGFGFTGSASAIDNEFGIGFDTYLNLSNASLTDTYDIVLKLSYSNSVNADGFDAYADSELTFDANGSEIFFSDIASDTSFGDQIGGVDTGGFGEVLVDNGDLFFNFTLSPADVLELDMIWTLEGGEYEFGLAEADLSAFLSVYSIESQTQAVPLPSPLILIGLGLLLLPLQRRFNKSFAVR